MPWSSIFFFGGLYFLQGAILAYITNFQKPFLAHAGVSNENIAALTSAMLFPFIGKIFIGALSDRVSFGRFGKRKPFLLLGLFVAGVAYFLLARVNPSEKWIQFFALSVVATLGLALFDTTADGMAIDKTVEADQGIVQASMLAGKSIGLISFAFLFGRVLDISDVSPAFVIMGSLTLPVMVGCLIYAKPDQEKSEIEKHTTHNVLLRWHFWIFAVYAIAYSISSFGIDGIMTLFLNQGLKLSAEDIGLYGSLRGLGALGGAIVGGYTLSRSSKNRVALISILLLIVAGLLNSVISQNFTLYALGWGLAWGLQETCFVTMAMALSVGRWSATLFALCMMFSNIGTSIGENMATNFAASYPFAIVLRGLSAWLGISVVLLLLYIRTAPDESKIQ